MYCSVLMHRLTCKASICKTFWIFFFFKRFLISHCIYGHCDALKFSLRFRHHGSGLLACGPIEVLVYPTVLGRSSWLPYVCCNDCLLSRSRSGSYFTTDGQSVSQYIFVSGTPLGPRTRFYSFLSFAGKVLCSKSLAPSLTRRRVCNL
jgi:hypothetical protein